MDSAEFEVKKEPEEIEESQLYVETDGFAVKEETSSGNNPSILDFFMENNHPTTMKLMHFARSNHMTLDQVFDQFEMLRKEFGVECAPGDSCETIRCYFPKKAQKNEGEIEKPVSKSQLIVDFFIVDPNPSCSKMTTFCKIHGIPLKELTDTIDQLRRINALNKQNGITSKTPADLMPRFKGDIPKPVKVRVPKKSELIADFFLIHPNPSKYRMTRFSNMHSIPMRELKLAWEKLNKVDAKSVSKASFVPFEPIPSTSQYQPPQQFSEEKKTIFPTLTLSFQGHTEIIEQPGPSEVTVPRTTIQKTTTISPKPKNQLIVDFLVSNPDPSTSLIEGFAKTHSISFEYLMAKIDQLRSTNALNGPIIKVIEKPVVNRISPTTKTGESCSTRNQLIVDFLVSNPDPSTSLIEGFAKTHSIPLEYLVTKTEQLTRINALNRPMAAVRKMKTSFPSRTPSTTVPQNDPNFSFHESILLVFSKNPHPVIRKMIELSVSLGISYQEVFVQFEKLRSESGVFCPHGDTCLRVRSYFEQGAEEEEEGAGDRKVDGMLEREFARLDAQGKLLDEGELHLIADRQKIRPSYIRKKYNEPRSADWSQFKSLTGL